MRCIFCVCLLSFRAVPPALSLVHPHIAPPPHPPPPAPELLANKPYGHSVDWWSLGVVAFCLVYGRYPYSRGVDKLAFDRSAKDREIMLERIERDYVSFPELAAVETVDAIRKVCSVCLVLVFVPAWRHMRWSRLRLGKRMDQRQRSLPNHS